MNPAAVPALCLQAVCRRECGEGTREAQQCRCAETRPESAGRRRREPAAPTAAQEAAAWGGSAGEQRRPRPSSPGWHRDLRVCGRAAGPATPGVPAGLGIRRGRIQSARKTGSWTELLEGPPVRSRAAPGPAEKQRSRPAREPAVPLQGLRCKPNPERRPVKEHSKTQHSPRCSSCWSTFQICLQFVSVNLA